MSDCGIQYRGCSKCQFVVFSTGDAVSVSLWYSLQGVLGIANVSQW